MILKNVSHFGDHCFKEFSSSWASFIMLLFVSLPLTRGLETGIGLRLNGTGLANLFLSKKVVADLSEYMCVFCWGWDASMLPYGVEEEQT